ncbi:hypothetical protein EOM09_04270 [bacterium]|nr:hypothetical protein [bacterium]
MNIEMFNQAINSIATKLEVPTKYILDMLMKSGKFNAIESVLFLICILILAYLFFKNKDRYRIKMIYQHKMDYSERNDAEMCYIFSQIFILISLLFCLIFFIGNFMSALKWLIDPEVYAFQKFFNMIK